MIGKELTAELAKATGYSVEAFEAICDNDILKAYEIASGAFEFCHDGPMGIEYQISNSVKPYLDKTVEWNSKTGRFEGVFWGEIESGDFTYRGWVEVDASDSTNYCPLSFEVQVVEGPDGEISDHPFLGRTFSTEENEFVLKADYEI